MGDTLWLPVTPSIRRIAIAHLCVNPPKYEHIWWPLDWEHPISRHLMLPLHIPAGLAIARVRLGEVLSFDRRFDSVNVIGDMVEVGGSGWGHCFRLPATGPDIIGNQPAAVAYALRHLDPELQEAPNADR